MPQEAVEVPASILSGGTTCVFPARSSRVFRTAVSASVAVTGAMYVMLSPMAAAVFGMT